MPLRLSYYTNDHKLVLMVIWDMGGLPFFLFVFFSFIFFLPPNLICSEVRCIVSYFLRVHIEASKLHLAAPFNLCHHRPSANDAGLQMEHDNVSVETIMMYHR